MLMVYFIGSPVLLFPKKILNHPKLTLSWIGLPDQQTKHRAVSYVVHCITVSFGHTDPLPPVFASESFVNRLPQLLLFPRSLWSKNRLSPSARPYFVTKFLSSSNRVCLVPFPWIWEVPSASTPITWRSATFHDRYSIFWVKKSCLSHKTSLKIIYRFIFKIG